MNSITVSQIINNEYWSVLDKLRLLGVTDDSLTIINDAGEEYDWLTSQVMTHDNEFTEVKIVTSYWRNSRPNVLPSTINILNTRACEPYNTKIAIKGNSFDTLKIRSDNFGAGVKISTERSLYFSSMKSMEVGVTNASPNIVLVTYNGPVIGRRMIDTRRSYKVNNIHIRYVKDRLIDVTKDLVVDHSISKDVEDKIRYVNELSVRFGSWIDQGNVIYGMNFKDIKFKSSSASSGTVMAIDIRNTDALNKLFNLIEPYGLVSTHWG